VTFLFISLIFNVWQFIQAAVADFVTKVILPLEEDVTHAVKRSFAVILSAAHA
jgi:hypothetical protein